MRVRLLTGASVALGLALLALLWFVLAGDERRALAPGSAPPALESASAPTAVALQEPPRPEPVRGEPALAAAPSIEARASASGPRADELARALWVEGHVLFPPGTPADEAAFVLARGKEFADGSLQRAPVAADGSFRVAFSERSKTGWLLLEARYLYLAENYRWKKDEPQVARLEPRLGGCLEGRLVPPAGASAPAGGRVRCEASAVIPFELARGERPPVELHGARTFTFGGLVPGAVRVRYEGQDFWAPVLERRVEAGVVSAVELELLRGAQIAGRVTWPDGRAAEGAHVSVAPQDAERADPRDLAEHSLDAFGGETTADADGRFRVAGLGPGTFRVQARAEVQDPTAAVPILWKARVEDVAGDTTELALVLDAGLTLTGTIRDERGAPLAGAAVYATPRGDARGRDDSLTTSRRDGSFALTGLWAGTWSLGVSLDGYVRIEGSEIVLPAAPLELVLQRGVSVSGVVLDEDGSPSPQASVYASPQEGPGAWAAADARGAFELSGLEAGLVSVTAEAEGFAPSAPLELELAANEARRDVVLRVRRGGNVVGDVLDHEGEPVAGALVTAEAAQQTSTAAQCDEAGRFELTGLLPGEARLEATLLDGLSCAARVTVLAGETVRVRLQAPEFLVHLHGRVRIGGLPAVGAQVRSRTREADTDAFGRQSEADGAYALDLPGPGGYWIGVQAADSSAFQWIALDVPSVRDFEHDLEFAVGRISGSVLAKDGAPLSGVWVVARQSSDATERNGWSSAASDERGRYELVLPPATYELVAGGDRGDADPERSFARASVPEVLVTSGAELRGVDFVLELGATLEGVVRWGDGTSAVGAELWIGPQGAVVESDLLGRADDRGRFHVEGVAAGKYVVTATLGAGTAEWHRLTLAPGAVERFELELLASAWLEVRVRERSGQAVAAEVQALDARQKSFGAVQAEGPLARLGPLPSGRYHVRARVGERTVEGEVEITGKEETKTLELALD